jgi:hypothetical protein
VMLVLWPKSAFKLLCQFHSDSERGLGPIVASLSLGSAAVMHFRVHADVRQEGEGTGNALTLTLRHVSCNSDPCSAVDANSTSGRCFGHGGRSRSRILRVSHASHLTPLVYIMHDLCEGTLLYPATSVLQLQPG